MASRIIFITGTDTGVGKTVLTALLLCYLRSKGVGALALKPFCSGGREDAELLHALQDGDLTMDEINPFYFPEPVAPLVSARRHKRKVALNDVVQHINSIASRSPASAPRSWTQNSKFKFQNYLLVEGSGGLLVPLGEGYTVRDLIARLDCPIVVVSRNQLGTINHTLLTVQALLNPAARCPGSSPGTGFADFRPQPSNFELSRVVLMSTSAPDASSRSNPAILSELLGAIPLLELPFLGRNCNSASALKQTASKFHKTLGRFFSS